MWVKEQNNYVGDQLKQEWEIELPETDLNLRQKNQENKIYSES